MVAVKKHRCFFPYREFKFYAAKKKKKKMATLFDRDAGMDADFQV